MKPSKMRLFTPLAMLTLVAALLLGAVGSAFAADTWTPNFDGTQHRVYVDPKLLGSVVDPSSVSQLESQLDQRSAKEGIQYFFVYSSLGDEKPATGQSFGDLLMGKLTTAWQSKSGFPLETYQVIMLVRDPKGRHIYALNGGNLIQKEGLTPTFKAVGDNAFHTYMPNDPSGFALAVADSINGEVNHYHFMHVTLWYIIIGGTIFLVLLVLTFLFLTKRSKMSALLEKWRQYANHCGELSDKLEGAHMGFLKEQQVYSNAFAGATKTRFEQARNGFANLTSRQLAIQDLYDRAVKAAKSAVWPMFWQADHVAAMLSTNAGDWTGDELPDSKKTLKDYSEKITWRTPQELIDGYDALYTETDNELKEIADAFRQTSQNAAAIKTMLGEIDGVRPTLENEAQLPFAPYQERYDSLKGRGDKVLDLMASNPIGAKAESEAVEKGIESLKGDMLRAVSIKKAYTVTIQAIAGATSRTAATRDASVAYSYPFVTGEEHPTTAGDKFLLTEENGNPDGAIKEANAHYSASQAALVAAELDKAASEKAAAETSAASANSIIDAVLAAKLYVEKQVSPVRSNLSTLREETPAADTAMADLTANFITGNFAGQKDNVRTAKTVAEATEAQLGQARAAYHAQHFLSAQSTVSTTGASITSARQGLSAVHSRLAELKSLRDHAKATAAQVDQLNRSLAIKQQQNSTVTSYNTDRALANQQASVITLVREVAKPVTDWVAMASSADSTLQALRDVDHTIDADRAAHELAVTRVSELNGSVNTANESVDQPDTRQPARDKLNEAVSVLNSTARTLQTPKSDWASVTRSIDGAKAAVTESVRLAAKDHELATSARTALESAATEIRTVGNTDYARSQSIGSDYRSFDADADCSNANRTFAQAQEYMRERNYEQAKAYADSAYEQAQKAGQAAAQAVAVAIAAAVEIYEAAQRQAAQDAADALARQQAQNNPVSTPDFSTPDRTVSMPDFQDNNRTVSGGDDNFGQ